jgi:hypothetical protein
VPGGTNLVPPPIASTGSSSSKAPTGNPNSGNSNLRRIGGRGTGEGAAGTEAAKKTPVGTPWTAILLAVLAALALAGGVIAIAAPAALRALSSRPDGGPRQRGGGGLSWVTTAFAVVVVAGVVALALYRLLSRTKGLDLTTGWTTVGIAFGAAAVVVLAVPSACRTALRRWRWMRATDDAERAHAAWQELRADLADFGVGYLPSESPRALAGRVTGEFALPEPAAEAVSRIALAEERATYAGRATDSRTLRQDGAEARRGIASAAGRGARWRSRILPASVMGVVADATAGMSRSWTSRTWLRWASDRV